jgi:hypothetical protein
MVKQLSKLVKVRYVEDVSDTQRLGVLLDNLVGCQQLLRLSTQKPVEHV